MRNILSEIVKQTSGQITTLKCTGSAKETRLQGVDENKLLFLEASLAPIPELEGEFGISNLHLLKGLLNYGPYRAANSVLSVKRRVWGNKTTVEQFEFRDEFDVGTNFRCMSPERVPDQAEIRDIPWDIEFTPDGARLAEFAQLAGLFGGGDLKEKLFGLKVAKTNLIVSLGDTHGATHLGNMVLATDVTGTLKTDALWSHSDLFSIMRLAAGQPIAIKVSSRGVLGVEITTSIGAFKYYLRAQAR